MYVSLPARAVRSSSYMYVEYEYVIPEELLTNFRGFV